MKLNRKDGRIICFVFVILFCLLVSLFSVQIVSSDGCAFTVDYNEHVYLPDQKAVIYWDGTNETMIISTKIKSNNLSDIAWITPIQSSTEPEVKAGNPYIFNEIAEHFREYHGKSRGYDLCFLGIIIFIIAIAMMIIAFIKRKSKIFALILIIAALLLIFVTAITVYIYSSGTLGSQSNGVELIDIKTVDIYDVATLKATNATQLVSWLNTNGFIVPQEAISVLDFYCNQDNQNPDLFDW